MKKNLFFTILLSLLLTPELATAMNKKNNLKEPLLQNHKEEPLHAIPAWEDLGDPTIFSVSQEQITLFQDQIAKIQNTVTNKTYQKSSDSCKEIISKLQHFLSYIENENNMVIICDQKKLSSQEYRRLAKETIQKLLKKTKKWEKSARREEIKNDVAYSARMLCALIAGGGTACCMIGSFVGLIAIPTIIICYTRGCIV